MHAFTKLNIEVTKDAKVVGIDKVSAYMTNGVLLTQIKVPHDERAKITINRLIDEISNDNLKVKIKAIPKIIYGESNFKRCPSKCNAIKSYS